MDPHQRTQARTPLGDERIIALYWARDERAIDETAFKYRNYLYSVAFNIVHDAPACEECLNDTYLATWNAIPPATPNVLKAFLTTVLRRIAINRYHLQQRHSRHTVSLGELEGILSDEGQPLSPVESRALARTVSDFVRALPQRRRFIFMSRYYAAEPIDNIAARLKVSRSTVNKELAAIRRSLKEKLESEGYSL